MLCTNSKILSDKARYLSTTAKDDYYDFTHNDLGYNFRISNINACIGYSELKNLNKILKKKLSIFKEYKNQLKNEKRIKLINYEDSSHQSNFWLIVVKFKSKIDLKKKFMQFSKKNFFETRSVWKLLYLQKFLKHFNSSECKSSKNLIKNCFCLPSGTDLKKSDVKKISNKIKIFIREQN